MFNERLTLDELKDAGNIGSAMENAVVLVNELLAIIASLTNTGQEVA
jgi:hypothetical protein